MPVSIRRVESETESTRQQPGRAPSFLPTFEFPGFPWFPRSQEHGRSTIAGGPFPAFAAASDGLSVPERNDFSAPAVRMSRLRLDPALPPIQTPQSLQGPPSGTGLDQNRAQDPAMTFPEPIRPHPRVSLGRIPLIPSSPREADVSRRR